MENFEGKKDMQLNTVKSHNQIVKVNDLTAVINDEAEVDEYNLGDRDDDYIYFCDQRRCLGKVRPGRVKLLNEGDEQYVSIQCKSGDCPEDETERNELWMHNKDRMYEFDDRGKSRKKEGFDFNKTYKYKYSFRIPENFPLSQTRLVIGQWKFNKLFNGGEDKGPSPILAQKIRKINGNYYFVITNSHNKQIGEGILIDDIKGKWVDMEYKVYFSDRKYKKSEVEIMANIEGKEIKIYKGKYSIRDEKNNFKLNPDSPHTGYFKFGLYRDSYELAKQTINTDFEKSIKKINEDKKLNENEKKAKIEQANIEKDNDLNEIEQASKTENVNPMEIHFKNFSIENLSYDDLNNEKKNAKKKQRLQIGDLLKKL